MSRHVAPKDWRVIVGRAVTNVVQSLWWVSLVVIIVLYLLEVVLITMSWFS